VSEPPPRMQDCPSKCDTIPSVGTTILKAFEWTLQGIWWASPWVPSVIFLGPWCVSFRNGGDNLQTEP
jgi:hypothetical protein